MMKDTHTPDSPPIPPRPAAFDACPIGQAERLAHFSVRSFGTDVQALELELIAWRDREKHALSNTLLVEIAQQVARSVAA